MHLNKILYLILRRFLLQIVCIGVLGTTAYSQISVGARTGVNLNQFTMPHTTIGINAGVYGVYKFASFVSVRLEMNYSQEGGGRQDYLFNVAYNPYFSSYAGNISYVNFINPYVYMHNLQIPIMAELTLPEFDEVPIKPIVLLGGSYGYMFSANELHTTQYVFDNGTFANIPYLRENVGSSYKASQLSLITGVGIVFKGDKRDFSFDVRYRQGITQLNRVTQSVSNQDGRLFSSTLSFNFSMTILKF